MINCIELTIPYDYMSIDIALMNVFMSTWVGVDMKIQYPIHYSVILGTYYYIFICRFDYQFSYFPHSLIQRKE